MPTYAATWADEMRAMLAQMAGAMRGIQAASQDDGFSDNLENLLDSASLSMRTRLTLQHLFPAVLAMAENLDDDVLNELGIDAHGLPKLAGFTKQTVAETKRMQLLTFISHAYISDVSHPLTVASKPFRHVQASISNQAGETIGKIALPEIGEGIYKVNIDWQAFRLPPATYFVEIDDGLEKVIATITLTQEKRRKARVL